MKVVANPKGCKSFYCWDGDVLLLNPGPKHSSAGAWQDIIFGHYKDGQTDEWAVGIKRNGEITGRSAFYYQFIVRDLAIDFLSGMIMSSRFSPAEIVSLKQIKQIISSGVMSVNSLNELLPKVEHMDKIIYKINISGSEQTYTPHGLE